MKKKICCAAAVVLAVIYIFFPRPASDLVITVSFGDFTGGSYLLYYTTDTYPDFSDDRSVSGEINYEKMQISFRLDGELEGHLTGLRLDFPQEDELVNISAVTVSSAGVIQKDFNPSVFFSENNVVISNNLEISVIDAANQAYVGTGSEDPYLVFSDSVVERVTDCFSHQTGSRMLVCLFIAACLAVSRLKIWKDDTELPLIQQSA